MFIGLLSACITRSVGESLGRIKCVSLNNKPCQARSTLININSNKPLYFPFTVSPYKCGGGCVTIDDPCAQEYVPEKLKNMNVEVFNLTLGVSKARFLLQHGSCTCKCRFNESVWNSQRKWNHDACLCDCKELDDWISFKVDFKWNHSTCDCDCDKACKIDIYLDIKNSSCENIYLVNKY